MSLDFLDPSLSDQEFAKRFVQASSKAMAGLTAKDFEPDPVQMQKLNDLVLFFRKAAKDLGGKIESISLDPVNPPCGITANFVVFDLFGNDIQRFCDVIRECSAISMDVTVDNEVSISCTIPNVFRRK